MLKETLSIMNDREKKDWLLTAANVLYECGRLRSSDALKDYADKDKLILDGSKKFLKATEQRPFGVSIIMPTFKGAERISRALDSLVAQTEDRANFEVVIISNGPLDGTMQVVSEYQKRYRDLQIVFLRSEIAGASHARNRGLHHARFSYCTFVDDDDYISPQYITTLLRHAAPNRVVFSKIVDFDEGGERLSPITEQISKAAQVAGSNFIARPFDVRGIMSMTCAKIAPTLNLMDIKFDLNLQSGEDVVFWTQVFVKYSPDLFVPDDMDDAVYYREVRQGSVSRRTDDFSFSVTERLEVMRRVQDIEESSDYSIDGSSKELVESRYFGQAAFIIKFLKENKSRYTDFLAECRRLAIRNNIIKIVNEGLADTLVISYCFPPFNDTSAIVMMKRIIGWKWPVRVISNDMSGKRTESPAMANAVEQYLASHAQLTGTVAFAHERAIREFAEQALDVFRKIPKQRIPSKVYSRAMWPASPFAAALIKIQNPEIEWVAEFSDPLVLDIHGQERKGDIPLAWLISSGLRQAIVEKTPSHAEVTQLFRLAELLPYTLADKLVFTNEGQRHYMLTQPWLKNIRNRAMSISTIVPHPSLPEDYYNIGVSGINVDNRDLNIGFFGSFYATRGLKEVLLALKRVSSATHRGIKLHVVSSDAGALAEEVAALEISKVVEIHSSLPYFDCLASFDNMDYLLVNDAVTAGVKVLNPYLPSKLSDYLGSGRPIWALAEPGSSLSKADLPVGSIMSLLGDEARYCEALMGMLAAKKAHEHVLKSRA